MQRKIFFNGKVLTQDNQYPEATAFAVENGKFSAVGNDDKILQLQNEFSELIDLHKKTVLPGFNDAHIHIWKVGNLMTYTLDLRDVKSIGEMQDLLNDYNKQHPELSWIQARGFNEAGFPDKKIPNKYDIDKIISDKPVCITRTCAHQIVVNSKALELAEITKSTPTPVGGEIKFFSNGELAGHFTETAIGLILTKIPKYTADELREMILSAQNECIRYGITSATDPAVDRQLLEVYKQMDKNGELKIRMHVIPIRVPDGVNKIYPNPDHYSSDHLVVNTVKFFADGGLSGKTAALKHPYKNSDEHGVLRLKKELFKTLALESQNAGFRIATHAIGDAAIEMVLEVYKEIAVYNNINHRIEHLGLPSPADLECMKELNISAVMQPVFIYELGKNFQQYVSDHYLKYLYPVRSVLDHGINLALSTDAPVVKNYHPFTNIFAATTRQTDHGDYIGPDQAISETEAFYAYTMGSAIAHGDEKSKGSIETGKLADFIICDALDTGHPLVGDVFISGKRV